MKLRDALIDKLDNALVQFRKEYRGGLQQVFATVQTDSKGSQASGYAINSDRGRLCDKSGQTREREVELNDQSKD